MPTIKPYIGEIKSRGQLTIPKKIREMSHWEEGRGGFYNSSGRILSLLPLKRLELDEARRELRKILKASGLSAEDLIAGIKEERERLYQETYGKKNL